MPYGTVNGLVALTQTGIEFIIVQDVFMNHYMKMMYTKNVNIARNVEQRCVWRETMTNFCVYEKHGGVCKKTGTYCNLGACVYEDLKEFEVVRHGKWIFNKEKHTWECSECHYQINSILDESKSNFCPNCGAKMDGE